MRSLCMCWARRRSRPLPLHVGQNHVGDGNLARPCARRTQLRRHRHHQSQPVNPCLDSEVEACCNRRTQCNVVKAVRRVLATSAGGRSGGRRRISPCDLCVFDSVPLCVVGFSRCYCPLSAFRSPRPPAERVNVSSDDPLRGTLTGQANGAPAGSADR